MADEIKYISSITLPTGNTYQIKDSEARELIETIQSGSVVWAGVTTTAITDGSSTPKSIVIGEQTVAVTKGMMVGYTPVGESLSREFIYNGEIWQELGGLGALKKLAYKDSVSATYTPAGSNAASTVTFADSAKTSVLKADATFTTTKPDVTINTTGNTADVVTAMPTATVPKTVKGTTKYIKPGTTTVPNVTSAGSKGQAASWSATVTSENLTFAWTANTPTTPPTLGTAITVMNGISSASSSSTGSIAYIDDVSESGTSSVSFGTPSTATVLKSTTTAELAAAPTTTADTGHTVSAVTGNGSAAAQKFTGTQATITSE